MATEVLHFDEAIGAVSVRADAGGEPDLTLRTETEPLYREDRRAMLAELARQADAAASVFLQERCPDVFPAVREDMSFVPALQAALAAYPDASPVSPEALADYRSWRSRMYDAPEEAALPALDGLIDEAERVAAAACGEIPEEQGDAADDALSPLLERCLRRDGPLWTDAEADMERLYGFWCFGALAAILQRYYRLCRDADALSVFTEADAAQCRELHFTDVPSGADITLSYDPTGSGVLAAGHGAGALIALALTQGDGSYRDVFVPEYRLEDTSPADAHPGPQEKTLHAVLRYRETMVLDAARSAKNGTRRSACGAFVLYPCGDGRCRSHHAYVMARYLYSGGIPLAPGGVKLAEELLARQIGESRRAPFPEAALPAAWEAELDRTDWSAPDVLVGTFRTREQEQINLTQNYYYTPAEYIPPQWRDGLRCVALYRQKGWSRSGIRCYGEVTELRLVKRKEIPVRMRPGTEEETYLLLRVNEWKMLFAPIEAGGEGISAPRLTNRFLLRHCRCADELFAVHAAWEFRLLYALQRAAAETAADETALVPVCRIDDFYRVWLHQGMFLLCGAGNEILCTVPVESFARREIAPFRELRGAIRI